VYPIILAHGICRFDHLLNVTFGVDNRDDDSLHYFRKIRSTLTREGFAVFHSNVGWSAGVEARARQLKEELRRLTDDFRRHSKVHIIAHSMGGLDARHMIVDEELHERVASLTTIGTPHHGSSFADWGMRRLGVLIPMLKLLGIDATGFEDLTTERCNAFNERAAKFEDECGVRFRTVAAAQERNAVFWPLHFSHGVIEEAEGPNDGLVSRESAKWREEFVLEEIEADHVNEIGWCHLNDPEYFTDREGFERGIRDLYSRIATSL
jgi:triacylglycerol lipase